MKGKFLSLSLALLVSQTTFANDDVLKPEKCPSISAIKSIGVSKADMTNMGWAAWNDRNRYDTNNEWTFVIFGLSDIKDSQDAILKYNKAISTLQYAEGPTKSNDKKEMWGCVYVDNKESMNIVGITVTPPVAPIDGLQFRK